MIYSDIIVNTVLIAILALAWLRREFSRGPYVGLYYYGGALLYGYKPSGHNGACSKRVGAR